MSNTNQTITETFFRLIRLAVGPSPADNCLDEVTLTEEERKQIISLAKAHDLIPIITSALAKQNLLNPATAKNVQIQTVWRYEKLNHELEQICGVLEKHEIDYIPLKGSVIRPYYPEPWMRTSCDIDILVHEEDLEQMAKVLIQDLSYTLESKTGFHHISMHAPNGIHLEPHFNLREDVEKMDRVLDEVWENSTSSGINHRFEQTNEFLVFHIIAHMAYHFQSGGCGIRPFIDLYLLDKKLDYNRDKLMDFCRRAGIERFYECVRQMIDVWFNEADHTDVTRRMEDFVLSGGVYGTKSNAVAIQQERAGNKFRQILTRIFMPYQSLKIKYPILIRHPWMTPIFEVVRWVKMICKKRLGKSCREFEMICGLSEERRAEIGRLLDDVGL